MSIHCGHCREIHATVQAVRECAAEDRRLGGIIGRSVRSTRTFTEQDEREMQRMEAEGDREETRRDEASKAAYKASVETPLQADAEGLYRLSRIVVNHGQVYQAGDLFQVVRSKGSHRLYAKQVTFPEASEPASKPTRPQLTYVSGMIFDLLASELVPLDEVEELTRKTGLVRLRALPH